ncbi:hypothetical protein [Clostridium estertheticum]|uniref:hypothetical protein n=1 Tax=Clostridium estertheticum TaxID=238834 RepID=UPI001CF4D494|nr:hypothetical protein [Clostridium estertheticum]MCB2340230.1 hypothetical protein [Clostridium estertheticum]
MENKRILLTILSVATYIICLVLNIAVFISDIPITMKNVIVTLIYISVLILATILEIIIKNIKIVKYLSMFWFATLFSGVLLVYINTINTIGLTPHWMTPFMVLFISPWCGLGYFVNSNILNAIIITLISLIMFIITVISLKHTKSA